MYKKHRNITLAVILNNDPARLRERTVLSKRGRGRKTRPRNSNRFNKEAGI